MLSPLTRFLLHFSLWFFVLCLFKPCHSSTFRCHPLRDAHPISLSLSLSPSHFSFHLSLPPFSLLMSNTLKSFPGMINVLLGLTLFFFWRVNTKRKWGKSLYLSPSWLHFHICQFCSPLHCDPSFPLVSPRLSSRMQSLHFTPSSHSTGNQQLFACFIKSGNIQSHDGEMCEEKLIRSFHSYNAVQRLNKCPQ